MGWESNAIFQVVIIQGTAGSGLFAYSPSPGLGNLVASIASVPGTDIYGNAYVAGDASYAPGPTGLNFAVSITGNSLQLFTGPVNSNGAGPWTARGILALDVTGTVVQLTTPSGGFSVTGGLTALQNAASVTAALAGGKVLQVTDTTAAPTSPILQIIAAAATPDFSLGIQVTGDTNQRFRIDSDGSVHWGTGAAATDTVLSRTAAGVLSAGAGTLVAAVVEALAAASGNATLLAETAGDTNPRFQVLGSGSAQWGPGNAAVDTTLARTAAGTLTVTSTLKTSGLVVAGSAADQVALSNGLAGGDVLKVTNTTAAPTGPSTHLIAQAAADRALGIQVAGDTVTRLLVDSNGKHSWGPGGASAQDVTMQRNSGHLDVTATDGNTYSAERLTQVNTGQTITTVSPTVTALTGLSAAVANGTTYRFRLWVAYNGSVAAGAPVFEITGPTTSFSAAQLSFTTNGTATVTQRGAGLNTLQTGPTFQTAQQLLVWEGIFTPSANGTLAVSGATNTSGDNLVINGAAMDLFPVI